MILIILAALCGLYFYVVTMVDKQPYKDNIEKMYNYTDIKIWEFVKQPTLRSTPNLKKYCLIVAVCCLISWYSIQLFPENLSNYLFDFIANLFGLSVLIVISVEWVQFHKRSFLAHLKNPVMLALLLFPTICYLLRFLLNENNLYESIMNGLHPMINNYSLFWVQLFWILIISLLIYIGFWIIALPVYFFIFLLISLIRKGIDAFIIKYKERKYLDALVRLGMIVIPLIGYYFSFS
ncbi:hypothetical protein [Aquimarina algicola]|uniref:Uncharacterized protein n=1 Tax=Aquimarina algicola TaxID=2589995 RepID=A0A504JDX4_9FLAO|nr:hypothetical protein [Aquimarina algicola]TPN85803.1 hypothetical protein FHK87_10970 [Aquimarina algicola]